MEMLRHHHITPHDEIILLSDFIQVFEKHIAAMCRSQELLTTVTPAGDKVSLTASMEAPQSFGHGRLF